MRIVAMLVLAACGARAAPQPLANHGGAAVPAEPPVVTLDVKDLARGPVELDRATPMTLVVTGTTYGDVVLDGKLLGVPPIRVAVAPGHHHLAIEVKDY